MSNSNKVGLVFAILLGIGGNGTADDLAMARRLELQTNFASLLAIWHRLILSVSMRDFLRFTQPRFRRGRSDRHRSGGRE